MKENARDLTFLIPVRIDSIERLENVLSVVNSIHKCFLTNIIVLEASYYNNGILSRLLPKYVDYLFVKDVDVVFYRTRYLNQMCRRVKTDFLAIWDADIVATKSQLMDTLYALRENHADIAFPHNGILLETGNIIRTIYIDSRYDIRFLKANIDCMEPLYGHGGMKGGAILVNTKKYIQAGMENENFYGWGPEDSERYRRWRKMGYRIYQNNQPIFHLSHPRDMNGRFRSEIQKRQANYELSITTNSSIEKVLERLKK